MALFMSILGRKSFKTKWRHQLRHAMRKRLQYQIQQRLKNLQKTLNKIIKIRGVFRFKMKKVDFQNKFWSNRFDFACGAFFQPTWQFEGVIACFWIKKKVFEPPLSTYAMGVHCPNFFNGASNETQQRCAEPTIKIKHNLRNSFAQKVR